MYKMYINGKCVEGAGDKLEVTCPATGWRPSPPLPSSRLIRLWKQLRPLSPLGLV